MQGKDDQAFSAPELRIPAEAAQAIRDNTHLYIHSLFYFDPVYGVPTKRSGAASIVVVMERSGTIAASGVIDYFRRHRISDPRLIVLSHMGHELEEFCGSILYPDIPEMTDQALIDDFVEKLRHLVSSQTHPITQQVRILSEQIASLPKGFHEIQLIDDYIAQGGVNEVIMPTIVELAAQRARLSAVQMQITRPMAEQIVQRHIIDEEPHQNQFATDAREQAAASATGKTIRFDPDHSIAMAPEFPHWLDQIVEASFGPGLSLYQAGFLNEALRGSTDFDQTPYTTPASMAFSRAIAARGFDGKRDVPPFRSDPQKETTTLLTQKGVPEDEIDQYISGLRARLCEKIILLVRKGE